MTVTVKNDSLWGLPPLLNEQALSDLLGIPVSRVKQWRLNGRLGPFVKVGDLRLMRKEAFRNWLVEREGPG